MHPLKNTIYEIVQAKGNITDEDLLNELKKKGIDINERDLNKAMMHLEIHGLISVRWIGKDRKRIEVGTRTARPPQTIW